MRKILVLVCAVTLIFAGTAFAEPIEFPNGLTIDVAPGWSYEGEGNDTILTAEDESCVIFITIADAEGVSAKDAAEAMSKEHGGSEPVQVDDETYLYVFNNQHGVECKVFVGIDNGKLKVLSIFGDHKDVESILDSIVER